MCLSELSICLHTLENEPSCVCNNTFCTGIAMQKANFAGRFAGVPVRVRHVCSRRATPVHYKTKPLIGGIFFFKENPPTIGQNYGSLTNRLFFKIDANFLKNLTMVQVFSGGTTLFGLRIIFSVNREVPIPSPDGEHERREKVDSAHSL